MSFTRGHICGMVDMDRRILRQFLVVLTGYGDGGSQTGLNEDVRIGGKLPGFLHAMLDKKDG